MVTAPTAKWATAHNPSYDFNDDLIPLGATYWVRLAEEWFKTTQAA